MLSFKGDRRVHHPGQKVGGRTSPLCPRPLPCVCSEPQLSEIPGQPARPWPLPRPTTQAMPDLAPARASALSELLILDTSPTWSSVIHQFVDLFTNHLVDRLFLITAQVTCDIDLLPRPLIVLSSSRQIALSSAFGGVTIGPRIPSSGELLVLPFVSAHPVAGRPSKGSLAPTEVPRADPPDPLPGAVTLPTAASSNRSGTPTIFVGSHPLGCRRRK